MIRRVSHPRFALGLEFVSLPGIGPRSPVIIILRLARGDPLPAKPTKLAFRRVRLAAILALVHMGMTCGGPTQSPNE